MDAKTKQTLAVVGISVASSLLTFGAVSFVSSSRSLASGVNHDYAVPVTYTSAKGAPVTAVNTDFTVAAEKTVHAVVHIKSTATRQQAQGGRSQDPFFDFFFGDRGYQRQPQPQVGFGSGVIISSDGYIVTNNHVIDGAEAIEVTLNDKRSFNAVLKGRDPNTDLALLKIDAKDLQFVTFGNSDALKVGEWVLAVGNPFNLTSTVTAGIVSAKARNIDILAGAGSMKIESFIQTDAAVNPGNSGGALVNTQGELVGINTAIASETGNYTGYSFAVPASIVSKVVTDLQQYGSVQRAVLGIAIRDIDAAFAKEKSLSVLEGVFVNDVVDRGAAKEAGIESGDIITAVNGVKVKAVAELQEQVGRYRPGDKIKIDYVRGKEQKSVGVVLKNRQGNTSITKDKGIDILGAAFKPISDSMKRQLQVSYGVEVTGLTDGKFRKEGIKKGFIILKINDQRISSEEDIEKVISQVSQSSGEQALFVVGIYPTGTRLSYYAIDLTVE